MIYCELLIAILYNVTWIASHPNFVITTQAVAVLTQVVRDDHRAYPDNMGPTWGPSGAVRTQMGPMLAPWTLLSGYVSNAKSLVFHWRKYGWLTHWRLGVNLGIIGSGYGLLPTRQDISGLVFIKLDQLDPWIKWNLKRNWGRDKITAISQTKFSNAFPWIKNIPISLKISLKFVAKVPINIIPAMAQIMAWRQPGDKPLFEPIMVSILMHICITRPQWVKSQY